MSLKEIYDPKTAFGNPYLIDKLKEADAESRRQAAIRLCGECQDGKVTVECDWCNGSGEIEDDCDHEHVTEEHIDEHLEEKARA